MHKTITFEPSAIDQSLWRQLTRCRNVLEGEGKSLAIALPDWHVAVADRADGPIVILAGANRSLIALGTSDDLLRAFGYQFWMAFSLATTIRPSLPANARPLLDGIDLTDVGIHGPIHGAKVYDIITWIP